jgi:hypothetical protein
LLRAVRPASHGDAVVLAIESHRINHARPRRILEENCFAIRGE